jgi:hypothetical protein
VQAELNEIPRLWVPVEKPHQRHRQRHVIAAHRTVASAGDFLVVGAPADPGGQAVGASAFVFRRARRRLAPQQELDLCPDALEPHDVVHPAALDFDPEERHIHRTDAHVTAMSRARPPAIYCG